MMPIFDGMEEIDLNNPKRAIAQLVNHIKRLEEKLYTILTSLDGANLLEMGLDDVTLKSESGSVITGDKIVLKGPEGESFEVGYDKTLGRFVFKLTGGSKLDVDLGDIVMDGLTVKKLTVQGTKYKNARLVSDPDNNQLLYLYDSNDYGFMTYQSK